MIDISSQQLLQRCHRQNIKVSHQMKAAASHIFHAANRSLTSNAYHTGTENLCPPQMETRHVTVLTNTQKFLT
jgi:hypothetical protein